MRLPYVYLVLDLSNSMVYDTPRPSWWNDDTYRAQVCPGLMKTALFQAISHHRIGAVFVPV